MAKSMRTAVFVAPGEVELRELPIPEPGDGRIVVGLRATALCTMEQRIYLGKQHVPLPWVGGHELAGVIENVGDVRSNVKVGQRVALGPVSCGQCEYCRRGYDARCLTGFTRTSYAGIPGGWGLSEFRPCQPAALYPIADHVSFEEAALSEPLSCAVHAIRTLNPDLARDVVVIGAGPMGLFNVLVARIRGARVIVSELDSARRRKVAGLGVEVLDPGGQNVVQAVKELTDGRGADAVIVAVGLESANRQAFEIVAPTGTVVLFANAYPSEPLSVDPNLIHKTELKVLGVEGKTVEDFAIAVKLLNDRLVDVRPIIETSFGLHEVIDALETAVRPETYRVIVNP
jgi:threonine dehydrogenase-like Zn-dependent dehydrogenase